MRACLFKPNCAVGEPSSHRIQPFPSVHTDSPSTRRFLDPPRVRHLGQRRRFLRHKHPDPQEIRLRCLCPPLGNLDTLRRAFILVDRPTSHSAAASGPTLLVIHSVPSFAQRRATLGVFLLPCIINAIPLYRVTILPRLRKEEGFVRDETCQPLSQRAAPPRPDRPDLT